jgi:hypothetical protein
MVTNLLEHPLCAFSLGLVEAAFHLLAADLLILVFGPHGILNRTV